ncbi:MerP protein [Flavobacterium sp. IR1]|nr:MerP protein [Flavobacterium sp. IR1]
MKNLLSTIAAVLLLFTANNIQASSIKTGNIAITNTSSLQPVYDAYFTVKDALIKSDAKLTSAKAKDLLAAITAVKMDQLKKEEHTIWMKVVKKLTADTKNIVAATDLKKQRENFKAVTKSTYDLIKISKSEQVVYKQYCPMADADWLSKEKAVKNPYYGSSMLTCGNVVETIK